VYNQAAGWRGPTRETFSSGAARRRTRKRSL
jgi:hypothetical protein